MSLTQGNAQMSGFFFLRKFGLKLQSVTAIKSGVLQMLTTHSVHVTLQLKILDVEKDLT